MGITTDEMLDLAYTFTAVGIALFWSLSLTQQDPRKKLGAFLLLWVLWGGSIGVFHVCSFPVFWRFLLLPVLAAGIWLLWGTPLYAAAAGLLASVFLELGQLLRLMGTPELPFLTVGTALALLCTWQKAVILPERSELLAIGDKAQTRKFNFCILLMVLTMVTLQSWQGYLLLSLPRFDPADQTALISFTIIITALLIGFLRRIAFDAIQRIEALIDKQYQAELLNLMQIIRSQRHDFNFHMQTISSLIENKKYQDCDAYIQEMVKAISSMNDMLPLQEPAVSAMLNSFQEVASQRGISLSITIHDNLSELPCTVYEINTIIGNLLQNAIDEVSRGSQKHITVLTLRRGGNHIIKVTNPVSGDVDIRDLFKPGYTTKQSHEGIGLATVERLVTKHHGMVYPELEDNFLSFIVRLPCIYSEP